MNNLEKIQQKLHKINFNENDGIVCPKPIWLKKVTPEEYRFGNLTKNDKTKKREHIYNLDCCPYCNEKCKDISPILQGDAKSVFTNITHGSHTLDFLDAHNMDYSTVSSWSSKPVLFVMENPGSYKNDSDEPPTGGKKFPSKCWYWINGQDKSEYTNEDFKYPNWFKQKEYGWMLYSVINTFQIANAYITNMVKCGACNDKTEYATTDKYNPEIIERCLSTHLTREINALRGDDKDQLVTVFAFGQNVYDTLTRYKKLLGECKIYLLPHPANHLANDYRKYVLLGKILRALLQTDFYDNVAMPNFYDILKNDKESDETFGLTKEFLQLNLVDYTSSHEDSGPKFNKSGSYEYNKITYQVCLDKLSILQVIFRYYSDEKKDYTVSWACYYPESGEIYLYKGKNKKAKSAQFFVGSNHNDYVVFEKIHEFAINFANKYPSIAEKEITVITELPLK